MAVNIFENNISLNDDDAMFLLDILQSAKENPFYDQDSQDSLRKMIDQLNKEIARVLK
jgi:uncharacterized protein (DUF2164 family)